MVENSLKIGVAALSIWISHVSILPAETSADMETEILHLLNYIQQSACIFIRNDKEYDGQAACDHIDKKYSYAKRHIKTTDDFIRYAASQSSISGKPYRVRCEGREMPTAEWLRAELERFRHN
jgi:hypothetical protein